MRDFEINSDSRINKETFSFQPVSVSDEITARNLQYTKLCARFLPATDKDSIWRYLPASDEARLEQGWKIHISATILTAIEVFEKVAPLLQKLKVRFKAPASLFHLKDLNTGIVHGYAQIGKFIIVYPQSDGEAVTLAEQLHQITAGFAAPSVPFDLRYKPESCVYYRYGSFRKHKIEAEDGSQIFVIRDPSGNFVPDLRDIEGGKPDWITNPFPACPKPTAQPTPLDRTFKVFRALSQRGKGGVYEAVDFSQPQPRLCIVKEGRRHGEIDWDGRDGFDRARHEEKMLRALKQSGVDVPQVYASFQMKDSFYLVLESIAGESLQDMLRKRKRRLTVSQVIDFGLKIAKLIAQIHSAGFVWRDLKPANLFVTGNKFIRPLDFEGACRVEQPDSWLWGTRDFIPREINRKSDEHAKSGVDLFSLGVVLYFLITGRVAETSRGETNFKISRRNVPPELRKIVLKLLDANPQRRPDAAVVCQKLQAMLLQAT